MGYTVKKADFGPHLMLDMSVTSDKLNDGPYWRSLLVRLVELVGMTPLSKPTIHASVCTNPAWNPPTASGLSGFIVLAESHVSFHTFVEARYVFLDLFSCKNFDKMKVYEFLKRELGIVKCDMHSAQRGSHFPFAKSESSS